MKRIFCTKNGNGHLLKFLKKPNFTANFKQYKHKHLNNCNINTLDCACLKVVTCNAIHTCLYIAQLPPKKMLYVRIKNIQFNSKTYKYQGPVPKFSAHP